MVASDLAALRQLTESPAQMTMDATALPRQTVSPASSGTSTPTPPSPASGVAGFIGPRQLRPRKSPLYMPAVLRPNHAARPNHITPPSSIIMVRSQSPQSMTRSDTNSTTAPQTPPSEFELGLQGLGKVTALPSKEHWKSDCDSDMCDDASCTRYFTYFNRKHHCRRCGNIFCDDHSTHSVPLDQNANFHPRGTPSRACGHCFNEYKSWRSLRSSRASSESSNDGEQAGLPMTPTTPTLHVGAASSALTCAVNVTRKGYFPPQSSPSVVGSLGSSVPRDWHWSTF